jgi:hypothetical protein
MIHHYNGSTTDQDGEIMLGYYYQFVDVFERPISQLMGPYGSASECQEASQQEYDNG